MSLSTLNYPPLVTAVSASTLPIVLPLLKDATLSLTAAKALNAGVYALSLYSVMQPGRYDGENQKEFAEGTASPEQLKQKSGMEAMSSSRRGRTLVAPSGWAFAIWGPIFLGELLFVTGSALLVKDDNRALASLLKQVTPPFIAANMSQILWTATFRPKYENGLYKYVSAFNLAGIAAGLSQAHAIYASSSARGSYDWKAYLLCFLPMSLHFGWTTAASLVNINGMFAMEKDVSAFTVAAAGHLSVVAATALGVILTNIRSAPVYGGVIAWALAAVASGMSTRLAEDDGQDESRVGIYGAKTQRLLATIGSILCAGASAWTAVTMGGSGKVGKSS